MIGNAHRGEISAGTGHKIPLPVILTLSLLGAFGAGPLHAGGNVQIVCAFNSSNCDAGEIVNAAWSDLAVPVRWWMNDAGAQNNSNQGGAALAPGDVEAELEAAFAAWETLAESEISFQDMGMVPDSGVNLDGLNLIYWSNSDLGPNTLATTSWFILTADFLVTDSNRDLDGDGQEDLARDIYPDNTLLPAGTIFDTDIAFNSGNFDWSLVPDPTINICDVRAVTAHEAGHFHGLSHSMALRETATMFPYFDTTSAAQQEAARSPEVDDILASARTYPVPGAIPGGVLSGRVRFSGGTGVIGAQVSAIDRNTGREAVAVFTSSGLEPSGDPAGTYRLEGLPSGSYMISVDYLRRAEHSMNTGWRWADATQTDYNATVNMANLDPVLVAPEFLSNSESAADDLSAPLVIDLAEGEEVILPDLVANTDFPAAPADSMQLNMGNNSVITGIPIGFSFPFYGTNYTQFVAYANGYLSLGVGFEDPINFDESGSRFFNLPRISALLRELDPSADGLGAGQGGPDVYVMLGATSVETIWLSIPEEVPGAQTGSDSPTPSGANTFSIGFDNAGHIWLEYRKIASPFGIGGLASGVGQIGVKEKFDFGRPRIVDANRATLENALRLSGVRIDFVPNINGSYVVSSPQWVAPEVAPPEGVGRLDAQGGQETQLSWPATGDAGYHVYRGSIADLSATGTYTAAGTCFRAVTAPETLDAMSPAGGEAFYYIVTSVREFGIEGPLGHNDLGIERPNAFPCVL